MFFNPAIRPGIVKSNTTRGLDLENFPSVEGMVYPKQVALVVGCLSRMAESWTILVPIVYRTQILVPSLYR